MIQNTFLNKLPQLVAGSTVNLPSHMAFSSSATLPVESDNTLTGEIGTRVSFDSTTIDSNSLTFTGTRSSVAPGASGDTLTSFGIMNSTTGGDMWATAIMSSLLHTTSFDIELNMTVRFDRG